MTRKYLVLVALAIAMLAGSCSTMADYEEARQVRLGLKAPSTPTPRPTATPKPVATPKPAVTEQPDTPPPKPLDAQSGTLFQPWSSPIPHDVLGEKSKKSADEAEAQVEANRPEISKETAPGPLIPVLKTLLRSLDDLTVVSRVFDAYAAAVHAVRISVEAFGLKPNLEALRRVREAHDFWVQWFAAAHIYPDGEHPDLAEIKVFYAGLDTQGKAASADIAAVNAIIDQQRTHPVPTGK